MFNGAKKVAFCKVVIGLMICVVGSSEIQATENFVEGDEQAKMSRVFQGHMDAEEEQRRVYDEKLERDYKIKMGSEPQDRRLEPQEQGSESDKKVFKRKDQSMVPGGVPPQQSNDSNKKKRDVKSDRKNNERGQQVQQSCNKCGDYEEILINIKKKLTNVDNDYKNLRNCTVTKVSHLETENREMKKQIEKFEKLTKENRDLILELQKQKNREDEIQIKEFKEILRLEYRNEVGQLKKDKQRDVGVLQQLVKNTQADRERKQYITSVAKEIKDGVKKEMDEMKKDNDLVKNNHHMLLSNYNLNLIVLDNIRVTLDIFQNTVQDRCGVIFSKTDEVQNPEHFLTSNNQSNVANSKNIQPFVAVNNSNQDKIFENENSNYSKNLNQNVHIEPYKVISCEVKPAVKKLAENPFGFVNKNTNEVVQKKKDDSTGQQGSKQREL